MSFVATANTIRISAGGTVTVANIATGTNTFRFLNANATATTFVGVFSTYTAATTADHPATSGSGSLIPVAAQWSETITGNFGTQPNPGTVYVAAITTGSTGQVVYVTPIKQ
jgi:hypothetical protein